MTPEETMAEIGTYSQDGKSWLAGISYHPDRLNRWSLYGRITSTDTARFYITGYLQEWYTEHKTAMGYKFILPIVNEVKTKLFLPALWQAYKAVEGITI